MIFDRRCVITSLILICLFSTILPAAEQTDAQAPTEASSQKILREARDAFIADDSLANVHPRVRQFIYMREGINYTPLLHIAIAMAEVNDPQTTDTIDRIKSLDLRAFVFTQVASVEIERGRKKDAEKTLDRAITLIKGKDIDDRSAKGLWPHVLGRFLWIHGDVESAKAAANKAGCPWESLDNEERQFQLARFHVSRGEIEKARLALRALPPDTFTSRKAQQSLRNDSGAGLYYWSSRPDASLTAEHVLLEWLHNGDRPDWVEQVLPHLPKNDIQKVSCYMTLATRYHAMSDTRKAARALAKAGSLTKSFKNKKIRQALNTDLLLTRLQIEGQTAVQAIKESGVLEKSRDKPWAIALTHKLLAADELQLALDFSKGKELGVHTRGLFAIALTKAGRHEEAMAHVKSATGPLEAPKMLLGIAMQLSNNGESNRAKTTIIDAIKKARKVSATNAWFPEENEVRHQDKWFVLDGLFGQAVNMGFVEHALQHFQVGDASIRNLARQFGMQNDSTNVYNWIKELDRKANSDGCRCFALLGLAEGLLSQSK